MTRIAILISGNGTNLQAIIDAAAGGDLPGIELAVVACNRREAYGIRRAIEAGIPVVYFPLLPYTNAGRPREDYDADLARILEGFGVAWVVLAGWMHLFTGAFVNRFPGHVLNLHPALPGTFPGTRAIERAFEAFQRGEIDRTGVMIHLVPDAAVDAGPVIAQVPVPIHPDDTLETLETRVHAAEHRVLIEALRARVLSIP